MRTIIILYSTLLFLSQAYASNCFNAQTQLEMNQCASESYKSSDK